MAKATLTLSDGTVVELESTDQGIAKILSQYNASRIDPIVGKATKKRKPKKGAKKATVTGLKERLETRITDGAFKDAKQVKDVQAMLATGGFTHSPQTISTQLIRFVRDGVLDRRKEGGRWEYFKK